MRQFNRRIILAKEHRAVDRELVIVHPVGCVEVQIACRLNDPEVCFDPLLVPKQRVFVGPALHVDVRRHVDEVPRVRHQFAQMIARNQSFFGCWRHLHQVDIEVQDAGMRAPRICVHETFQNGLRGDGFSIRPDGAFGEVPHLPRRLVHHRFGIDGADIDIVGERLMHSAHGGGIVIVPRALMLDGLALGIAGWKSFDQRAFFRRHLRRQRHRGRCRVERRRKRCGLGGPVHHPPFEVVIRAAGISDAPMRHGTVRIELQRALKANHGQIVIIGPGPDQPAIKPCLRFWRRCCHLSRIAAGVEVFDIHCRSPHCPGKTLRRRFAFVKPRDQSAGSTAPGFMMPSGSSAPLIARIAAKRAGSP